MTAFHELTITLTEQQYRRMVQNYCTRMEELMRLSAMALPKTEPNPERNNAEHFLRAEIAALSLHEEQHCGPITLKFESLQQLLFKPIAKEAL